MVEETQKTYKLTRKEQFNILAGFEETNDPFTPSEQLEDVTEEIFGALNSLSGC